jgi:hypothetical protein
MCTFVRTFLLGTLLLLPAPSLGHQTAAAPSGHWEGTIQAPETEVKIEIDLAANDKGNLAGTYGEPAQGVKGFPLSSVALEGRSLRFVVKGGDAPATFDGLLSADGRSISGTLVQRDYSLPFTMMRTGDARIAPAPKNAAIGKELEGTWNGTLELGTKPMRLVLSVANQPDGTAVGTIVSPDGSGVEIPIAIAQKASSVTIDVTSVGAAYVGVLNTGATELAGTWRQRSSTMPLTFRRAAR